MAYRGNFNAFGSFHLTTWVKRLLIANVLIFLATALGALPGAWLAFHPSQVLVKPWGVVTYMFVHGGALHLLGNMLGLFFFGSPLEERWGSREFIKYYLICGLGGALFSFVFAFNASVLGASAAVFGVMLAFAMNWPDAPIYIFGIFPVKAKWLVAIFVAIDLLGAFTSAGPDMRGGVAHFAHLGGFAAGWLYLKLDFRTSVLGTRLKRMLTRPRLTVVSGSPPAQQRPATRRRADERTYDDIDRVLDKISTQGMASLTPEELKLLNEASRRYKQN